MDFMNRGDRQQVQTTPGSTGHSPKPESQKSKLGGSKLGKVGFISFVVVLTVLIVAVIFSLVTGAGPGRNADEGKFVDDKKFQAVFLNGGQVYFGKVGELNTKYLKLSNIYYLRVNQQVQPGQQGSANDISLVKLGCELHGPEDSMLINREQVIFWENLKEDGQVAKAVAEYVKQNPEGQKCEQQQQQSGGNTNTNTNTAPATTNTAPATNRPATGTTTR